MLRHHVGFWLATSLATSAALFTTAKADEPAADKRAEGPPKPIALSSDELAGLSGGKETAPAIASITSGSNSGNSIVANTVSAGNITMESGALNFSGIGNFVMNTGQNNNLQGVLNVNISITPAL